ncbi:MAG: hypothetical protein M3275_06370 [Thermoproteota archaeon]|jgi:hypothetical protein|nr:hypothetical protein [Thermoproteota archaeon]HYZ58190.1 hypothetical protein [Nitrososphaeraceae archaeon]
MLSLSIQGYPPQKNEKGKIFYRTEKIENGKKKVEMDRVVGFEPTTSAKLCLSFLFPLLL